MSEPADSSQLLVLIGCDPLVAPLREAGYATRSFDSADLVSAEIKKGQARLCVLGPVDEVGEAVGEAVRQLRRQLPFTDVVLWHPDATAAAVRDALVSGARDAVMSRDPTDVVAVVARVVDTQKLLPRLQRDGRGARDSWRFEGMVARSPAMWDVFETCARTAETDATVLVLGETGTGKELVARAIHRRSKRPGRFVALNCGAVPEPLLDSELFGHVEGAFTGATSSKRGLFREADRGTLFLDEIGNIPLPAQFRLLRALQEGTVRPVGSESELEADARVIAATSRPLDQAVESGSFREDLLYRLDVIRIAIPPLRARREDVILLFDHFTKKLVRQYKLPRPEVSEGFLDALLDYEWPGNVRQLENYVERLLLTHRKGKLTAASFRRLVRPFMGKQEQGVAAPAGAPREAAVDLDRPLAQLVQEATENIERAYLVASLRASAGQVGLTAQRAGISRRTLLRKLKRYGIDRREFRAAAGEG